MFLWEVGKMLHPPDEGAFFSNIAQGEGKRRGRGDFFSFF